MCIYEGEHYKKSIRQLLVCGKKGVAFLTFVDEFVSLTERYIMDTAKLVLLGDFNLHINELADPSVDTIHDLLECFNLKNNIFFPIYFQQHFVLSPECVRWPDS